MVARHANAILLAELGGDQRQDSRRAEGGGDASSGHLHQVRRRPGVGALAPDPSANTAGGPVQQHPAAGR